MMASTSLIFCKNWLPKPSPLLAPLTKPAISTNSIAVGMMFSVLHNFARIGKRSSGTSTTPILGSIVQNG